MFWSVIIWLSLPIATLYLPWLVSPYVEPLRRISPLEVLCPTLFFEPKDIEENPLAYGSSPIPIEVIPKSEFWCSASTISPALISPALELYINILLYSLPGNTPAESNIAESIAE